MDGSDTEEVSFLPEGEGDEPNHSRYRGSIYKSCSKTRAVLITTGIAVFVIVVAVIAGFARPWHEKLRRTTKKAQASEPTIPLATNGEAFPWNHVRLPRDVLPEDYTIFIHPNLTTKSFVGYVDIKFRVLKSTNFIVLHINRMNITQHHLKHFEKRISITKILEYSKQQQLYLQLGRELTADTTLVLHLEFSAAFIDKLAGFYMSSYKIGNKTRFLATTQFEPTDARAAFPCFDEPDMKATFTLSIVRDPRTHNLSLFNMPLKKTEEYRESLLVDQFEKSVKMSTYLVAFIVCDFASISTNTENGTKVSVYAPSNLIDRAQFALMVAKNVTEYYEKFFRVPYPLPKQDLVAIPDFAAGAMENWGLITYRTTDVLYDLVTSSDANRQRVATTVAHELAHQWFGDLVTMKWWEDLWLNEGFASYVQYIGADLVDKDWHMFDQFLTEDLQSALSADSLVNSHPISITVKDPAQINELFDSISYEKGASLIRMMYHFLSMYGTDTLQNGLHDYITTYKYSNAETRDLWKSISQATGNQLNVTEVMSTWTSQMGYPVVTMTRHGNKLMVTQTRFVVSGQTFDSAASPYQYKWFIPLTFLTDNPSDKIQQKWMKPTDNQVNFTLPSSVMWIKGNINHTGFYRVNYDKRNWVAIIHQLKKDHTVFDIADRSSLLDDSMNLARAGLLEPTLAFDLYLYLVNETEYIPWSTALSNLHYFSTVFEDSYDTLHLFNAFVLKLISNLEKESVKFFENNDGTTMFEKYLHIAIIHTAINVGGKTTIDLVKRKFSAWMKEPKTSTIEANMRGPVYKAAIMYGNEEEWNYLWLQFGVTKSPTEKKRIMYALATTRNGNLLSRYLGYCVDASKIRSQDAVSVLRGVSSNPAGGKQLAWYFLQKNWDLFKRRYGAGSFAWSSILKLPGRFTSDYDYSQVKSFFAANKQTGSATRSVNQTLESIQMNANWLKHYQEVITEWLKKNTVA